MKKICFFMDSPFTLGGEQRVVTNLVNYLSEKYDVSFLLTCKKTEENYNMYNLKDNVSFFYLKKYHFFSHKFVRKIYKSLRYIFGFSLKFTKKSYCNLFDRNELIDIINQNEFDIVVGVSSEFYSILASINQYLIKCNIYAWQHSTFDAYFNTKNHRLYNQKKFVNFMFNNIDRYICQTNDDANKIFNVYGFHANVINNPNTFSNYNIFPQKSNTFLAVGRLVKVKNFDDIIKAFNLFNKKNKNWNLEIVGSGPEKENLMHLVSTYKLEKYIKICPSTSNIKEYYNNSKIYMMTSSWEGWGMVVTEAMQNGLAIISYDIPSSREIFGRYNVGIITEKGNIEKLASSMLKLADNSDLLSECSRTSVERSKMFDISVIGKKWEELINEEK